MLQGVLAQTDSARDVMKESITSSKEIATTIQGMIVDLQFQDRNSQIAGNSVNMLQECSKLFEKLTPDAEHAINGQKNDEYAAHALRKSIESIYSVISLGDIRYQFMQSLRDIGVLYSGTHMIAENAHTNESVELF